MKTSHLHDLWAGPDNSRLTNKQFSFRLPVHVAAKLAALCDIYPQKNRTQIVADLLTAALDDLEKSLPEAFGDFAQDEVDHHMAEVLGCKVGEKLYYLGGARGRFRNLANMHYQDIEKELGNDKPGRLFEDYVLSESYFDRK